MPGHDHDHDHDHGGARGPVRAGRRLALALGLAAAYLVAEVVGGLVSGSLALLSDAAHMFTDTVALYGGFDILRDARRDAAKEEEA